jgi:hypothetical protein
MSTYSPYNRVLDSSAAVNICGTAFSSKDVEIRFLGNVCKGIVSLDWEETYDKEYITVSGQYGKVLGEGAVKVTGSMNVLISEFMDIVDSTKPISSVYQSLGDIAPFDITITYYSQLANIRNTILYNVTITKVGGSAFKAEDKATYKDIEFIANAVRNQ